MLVLPAQQGVALLVRITDAVRDEDVSGSEQWTGFEVVAVEGKH